MHSTSRRNGGAGEVGPFRLHRGSVSCSCSGPVPVHTSGKDRPLVLCFAPSALPYGQGPGQPVLGDPAWAGCLDQLTSRGYF